MRNALQKGLSKPTGSNLAVIRSQNDGKNLEKQQNRNKILATVTNPGTILQATTHATGSRPVSPQQKGKVDNEAPQQVENPE